MPRARFTPSAAPPRAPRAPSDAADIFAEAAMPPPAERRAAAESRCAAERPTLRRAFAPRYS